MKILINATILSNKNTGLGVYTNNVLRRVCPMLDAANIDYDILCCKAEFLPENCRSHAYIVNFNGFISRRKAFSKVGKLPYDLIWSTTQHGIASKNKQIITIHDLTPLLYPKGRWHQTFYYKFILPKIIKYCQAIITVSENTKKDIFNYYKNCSLEKIRVASCGINKTSFEQIDFKELSEKYNLERKFYFCITGIHYFYKNLHLIVEAFKIDKDLKKYKVVIIGDDECKYGYCLKNLIQNYGLQEYFIFTGFIDNELKYTLLKNAQACLYPTLYEGFGLPVLEAMDVGTPVLCSNASSLPEVGGDAAIYFNPYDVTDVINRIHYLIQNQDCRNTLIEKGKKNLLRFDWDAVANKIFEVINELI